jgi:hypothetical protein
MNIRLKTKDLSLKTAIVFGLWLFVFGLIHENAMNIRLKTKDLSLKTGIVFGLWLLVFGLIF